MTENRIELKSIRKLLGMNFYIPDYQRGYRWGKQEVTDLLDDIQEFIEKKQEGFYCIQPLVVKERKQETFKLIKEEAKDLNDVRNLLQGNWEVIDGQQRLTTIHILLSYLNLKPEEKYSIEYETREDSKSFLSSIDDSKKEDNIDYCHMFIAKQAIETWFEGKGEEIKKEEFLNKLLDNVKFIWYESVDENPVKVFTRLNIGKISLTNAELIKALFLNKSNFQSSSDEQKIRLQQQEIASEWDKIEYTLQNDEFWLFLNKPDYNKPTRIDFIFDLMCEKNVLNLNDEYKKEQSNNDEYKTFRYFYFWFKKNRDEIDSEKIESFWGKAKTLFQTFQEWYNDLELYHYIGFLIEIEQGNNLSEQRNDISKMVDEWRKNKTKDEFISKYIMSEIKKKLSSCSDLNKQYEVSGSPKTQCRPVLLLHNIQTVINQNETLKENDKYKLPVFYKFPFHLFKKEKWDIEHIDSSTGNTLEDEKDQKEWLELSYAFVSQNIKDGIDNWLQEYKKKPEERDESKYDFEKLYQAIMTANTDQLENDEKDRLWNFCLLDFSTNRGYGNAIFPAKRRVITDKDQGKDGVAFVPPCTKNVFLKYYSPATNNLREWNKEDADAYLKNIDTTLKIFLNKNGNE